MPKVRMVEYEVAGRGSFPLDMLRHDRCWPAREAEANSAANDTVLRTIKVCGLSNPTFSRWTSFGWPVDHDSMVVRLVEL